MGPDVQTLPDTEDLEGPPGHPRPRARPGGFARRQRRERPEVEAGEEDMGIEPEEETQTGPPIDIDFEVEELNEDFIIEELQRGYHLEGKVLRHALVKVSMGPGKQNSQEEVEKDKVEVDIDSEENTSEDV